MKALLEPLIDFGVKSSEQAYADTLPDPLKEAIAGSRGSGGDEYRMVLAALRAPETRCVSSRAATQAAVATKSGSTATYRRPFVSSGSLEIELPWLRLLRWASRSDSRRG